MGEWVRVRGFSPASSESAPLTPALSPLWGARGRDSIFMERRLST
jgi:hypothetical protein